MASFKGTRAAGPAMMAVDGRAAFIIDKIVLGAAPGVGTPSAADTIDFLIPAGSRLAKMKLVYDDCDTGTALLYSVGYRPVSANDGPLTASTAFFAATGQTAMRAASATAFDFKPIKFEQDVYVSILIGTAMAGVSGNPEIWMIADITMEGAK